MKNSSFNRRLVMLLAASLLAGSCFAADDDANDTSKEKAKKSPKQMVSSSVKASESPIPRIWIGLTGSYTPLNILKANANGFTDNNGDAFSNTTAQGQVGGGAEVNARIYHNFWLNIGAIYRFTGYDWNEDTTGNVTGLSTPVGIVLNNVYFERSRVRLIDFPLMVRYTGKKYNLSKYTFYELGGSLRDGVSHTTLQYVENVTTSLTGPPIASGTNYRRMIPGATAGFGVAAKDDFGIIVSPEVRYTRWMGDTFSNDILHSQRNQLEVTVSFGF